MNMVIRTIAALCLAVAFSGCAHLYRDYSIAPLSAGGNYTKLVKELMGEPSAVHMKTDTKADPGINPSGLLTAECFSTPSDANAKVTCRNQRNVMVSTLVITSAEMCLAHRRSMYGNDAMWNISLGTMTNLFAGAASVIHTEKYRPILAALALLSNSERSLINETVYKQMLVTAVDKKIVETRETKMAVIYAALKLDIDAYSVQEALRDVVALHSTCSFIDGLQKALDEGTQDSSAKKIVRLRQALVIATSEEASLPTGNLNDTQRATLKDRIAALHKALATEEIR